LSFSDASSPWEAQEAFEAATAAAAAAATTAAAEEAAQSPTRAYHADLCCCVECVDILQ
jgi:hypothetical protein